MRRTCLFRAFFLIGVWPCFRYQKLCTWTSPTVPKGHWAVVYANGHPRLEAPINHHHRALELFSALPPGVSGDFASVITSFVSMRRGPRGRMMIRPSTPPPSIGMWRDDVGAILRTIHSRCHRLVIEGRQRRQRPCLEGTARVRSESGSGSGFCFPVSDGIVVV